jgi:hypothetical protein
VGVGTAGEVGRSLVDQAWLSYLTLDPIASESFGSIPWLGTVAPAHQATQGATRVVALCMASLAQIGPTTTSLGYAPTLWRHLLNTPPLRVSLHYPLRSILLTAACDPGGIAGQGSAPGYAMHDSNALPPASTYSLPAGGSVPYTMHDSDTQWPESLYSLTSGGSVPPTGYAANDFNALQPASMYSSSAGGSIPAAGYTVHDSNPQWPASAHSSAAGGYVPDTGYAMHDSNAPPASTYSLAAGGSVPPTGYAVHDSNAPLPASVYSSAPVSAYSLAAGGSVSAADYSNMPLSAHSGAGVFANLGGRIGGSGGNVSAASTAKPKNRGWWENNHPHWSDIIKNLIDVVHAREWQQPFLEMSLDRFIKFLEEAYEWYKEDHLQNPESLGKLRGKFHCSQSDAFISRWRLHPSHALHHAKGAGVGTYQ